jgi:hypothetical protein
MFPMPVSSSPEPRPSFVEVEMNYAPLPPDSRRLSTTAVLSFIVSLLASPLSMVALVKQFPRTTPISTLKALFILATVIAFLIPLLAMVRVLAGREVRGAGWAIAGLLISVFGWGIFYWWLFNFVPPGGAGTG